MKKVVIRIAEIKVVYGSPCSGKSTYVENSLKEKDIRFDYDLIMQSISNKKLHEYSDEHLPYVIEYRGLIIDKCYGDTKIDIAYIITTKITEKLQQELEGLEVEYILIDKTKDECYKQLEQDETREDKEFWKDKIDDWFDWYEKYKKRGENKVKIEVKGPIISNDEAWIYDWFEIDYTCPRDVKNKLIEIGEGQEVEVEINSGGGSVYAGSEIYTTLKDYKGHITIKILGIAASAASVIAMAGDKTMMSPVSQLMIHNASVCAEGDYRDMEHAAKYLKSVNSTIANAYQLKTDMTKNELLSLMDKETWMTPEEALKNKFIDEIMFTDNEFKAVASYNNAGVIPPKIINKLRNEFKKDKEVIDEKDKEVRNNNKEKEKTIENKLKEIDLILALR